MVSFIAQTGLRKSEAINLKWSDIRIPENYFTLEKTKEKRPRSIPLSPKARTIIDSIIAPGNIEYVFLDESGKQISVSHIDYGFRLAIRKSGLRGVCLHSLRHSFASRLVQRGASLPDLQALLGHSSPTMTARYAHLDLGHLKSVLSVDV